MSRAAEEFAQMTVDVIYDRREGFAASVYGGFLKALSYVFAGIVRLRYAMYRKRILRDAPLGCLVVVVGNLTVGGTGKTPIVEKFARSLSERGRKVAILSRGYKSKSDGMFTKFKRWLTHGEVRSPKWCPTAKMCCSTPSSPATSHTCLRATSGRRCCRRQNRVKAGHYAITEFGADTLILDDGFQYLPLRGQLQLLLVDKTNPFGNMNLLPRGILREPVSHLKRASYIFVTKSDGKKDAELERLIRTHNPTAEIIECAHKTTDLVDFSSGSTAGLDMLKGAKIACFSAIAAPDSFEKFLSELGAEIIYKKRFLDHHRFDDQELDEFFENAKNKGAEFVVTTEKDAVRIRADYPAAIPFFYTKLEIEILDGVDDFESAVEKICFPKRAADSTHGNA